MTQGIIGYIVAAIRAAFPGVEDVFVEQVKQGLDPPCFLVRCVSASQVLQIGPRRRRDMLFSVAYFPASATDAKAECHAVLEGLFDALEVIGVPGDLMRGTGMGAEIVDGVLVFTVSYNAFLVEERGFDPMETLGIERFEVV